MSDNGKHLKWQRAAYQRGCYAKLRKTDQAVLSALISFMDSTLSAYPSQRKLGRYVGIERNKVGESIRRLEASGLISSHSRGAGKSLTYRLNPGVLDRDYPHSDTPLAGMAQSRQRDSPQSSNRDTEQLTEQLNQPTRRKAKDGRSDSDVIRRQEADPVSLAMLERWGVNLASELASNHSPQEIYAVRRWLQQLPGTLPTNVLAGKLCKALKAGKGRQLMEQPNWQQVVGNAEAASLERHFLGLSKHSRLPADVEHEVRRKLDKGIRVHQNAAWADGILLLAELNPEDLIDRFVACAKAEHGSRHAGHESGTDGFAQEAKFQSDLSRGPGLSGRDEPRGNTRSELSLIQAEQQPEVDRTAD